MRDEAPGEERGQRPSMTSESERILSLYQRHAHHWDEDRGRSLFEKPWLDRLLALDT